MQVDATELPDEPADAIGRIVAAMRDEVLAVRMIDVALRGLVQATGAHGAALTCGTDRDVRQATAPVPEPAPWQDGDEGAAEAVLLAPLLNRLGPACLLALWHEVPGRRFGGPDRALVSALSGALRTVVEQDELLHEMSRQIRTDLLTGLLNRRGFEDELQRRLGRMHVQAERSTFLERGVLLFLDLDGFRPVNVRHGHEAGDAVLVAVAGLLRETFRPADLLARPVGDTFAVWLDGADELTAAERAEALRGTLPEVAASVLPEQAGRVTVSVGIAPADPQGTELSDLLGRADCGLSAAKNAGRDGWQVVPAG